MVKKKDGKPRFCIDFRIVNNVSVKDAYPLPYISGILDKLRKAKYISTIDLKQGYWQVPLAPESRPITAFTVPGRGLFQFKVMAFGLHSAPASFQRLLDRVIGPEMEPYAFAYLDDIVVLGETLDEHLDNLRKVFHRLREANLQLNPEKCEFVRKSLKYLGHVVTEDGICTDPDKISAINEMPAPKSVRELSFLGVASWYRRFIEDFSKVVTPLTALLKKKQTWKWETAKQTAFETLKQKLTHSPVLACPDFSKPFVLQTDASDAGLGAALTQTVDGQEKVIAYASRTLSGPEKNYSVTEKECLAIQYDSLSRNPLPTTETICLTEETVSCKWYRKKLAEVRASPAAFPDYSIVSGKLYRHFWDADDFTEPEFRSPWKLCVPKDDRIDILQENHDRPTAGHLGIAKTITRIARNYYWPGMFKEIARYVRKCGTCQRYKVPQQKPPGKMHPYVVREPWDTVSTDIVGPLPRSRKGNCYLVVMQDRFSKWVEARPLRRATANGVYQALYEDVILKFGCPKTVVSDNGSQYDSRLFKGSLRDLGIRHCLAPVYSPQCNPVERVNRTLKTMIAQFCEKDQRTWDEHLKELTFAINSARQESTGYTPAFLNFGREMPFYFSCTRQRGV
ncbi:uncharacterized protein LOC123314004 [Coccinella septempunctata]|uniref:uncharacterized protein LOC123314004 n=1 Tax=Coccinella septempunctata TaxID=41139 RepID=UPI001D078257|nr:uncharacterized protein LOC123314004 [Coccinella septempunctata]